MSSLTVFCGLASRAPANRFSRRGAIGFCILLAAVCGNAWAAAELPFGFVEDEKHLSLQVGSSSTQFLHGASTRSYAYSGSGGCRSLGQPAGAAIAALSGSGTLGVQPAKQWLGLVNPGNNCGKLFLAQTLDVKVLLEERRIFGADLRLNVKNSISFEIDALVGTRVVHTWTVRTGVNAHNVAGASPGVCNGTECFCDPSKPGTTYKETDATNCSLPLRLPMEKVAAEPVDTLRLARYSGNNTAVSIGGTGSKPSVSTIYLAKQGFVPTGVLPQNGTTDQVPFVDAEGNATGGYVQCKRLADTFQPVNYFLAATCTSTECRKDFLYDGPATLRFVCEAWWPSEPAKFDEVTPQPGSFTPTRRLAIEPTQQFWGMPPGVRGTDLGFCGAAELTGNPAFFASSILPVEQETCTPDTTGGGNVGPASCTGLDNITNVLIGDLIDQSASKAGVQAGCLLDERVRLLSTPANGPTQLQQFQRWYLQGDYTALRTRPAP